MDGSQSTHPHAASGSVTTSGSQSQSQPPPPALSQISHSPSSSSLTGTIPPPSQEGGQTCLGCGATSTPEWRRGPMGELFPYLS
ncbi:hypothetical protein BT96DRAFT_344030 [Gymnopus androsaceus JB14]|uniref:GATA-type domain-containing protein n=1 Tax=Gymnopus androsaceus JB14 TaxID=1447944 RepID=A0A6A4GYA7_9AGAR|nr:hypothetical protein BT96DRAFT_344030 [Gymnopus androsaceus JB14]